MKNYDTILFDLDGTLVDSGKGVTESVEYSLSKFGIKVEDKNSLFRFIGPPLYDSFTQFYNFSPKEAETAIKYYREYYKEKGIFSFYVYDGVEEMLRSLKKAGKRLIVATSKPEEFAHIVLDKAGISKYFDFIAGATLDEKTRATKIAVIEYAFENCNIKDTQNVLMIGDRCFDINGAKHFNMDSLGILYGYGSKKEFEEAGATYIMENCKEITDTLLTK